MGWLQSERKLVARLVIFRGLIYPQSPWRECTFTVIQLGFCLLISFIGLVNPSKSSWPWQPWPAVPPKMWPQQKMPWNSPCFFIGENSRIRNSQEDPILEKLPILAFAEGRTAWMLPKAHFRRPRRWPRGPQGAFPQGEIGGSNFSDLNETESYLWSLKSGCEMRCLFFFGRDEWRVLYSFGKWKHVENKWLCTCLQKWFRMFWMILVSWIPLVSSPDSLFGGQHLFFFHRGTICTWRTATWQSHHVPKLRRTQMKSSPSKQTQVSLV